MLLEYFVKFVLTQHALFPQSLSLLIYSSSIIFADDLLERLKFLITFYVGHYTQYVELRIIKSSSFHNLPFFYSGAKVRKILGECKKSAAFLLYIINNVYICTRMGHSCLVQDILKRKRRYQSHASNMNDAFSGLRGKEKMMYGKRTSNDYRRPIFRE